MRILYIALDNKYEIDNCLLSYSHSGRGQILDIITGQVEEILTSKSKSTFSSIVQTGQLIYQTELIQEVLNILQSQISYF